MGKGYYIRVENEKYIKSINYCVFCGCTEDLTIEHLHSQNTGGDSSIKNLTRSCKMCNSLKWIYTVEEFLDRIINKRIDLHKKLLWYIHRLKNKDQKRYGVVEGIDLEEWLLDKIRMLKKEHTYFTSIINSITNRRYLKSHNFENSVNG